MYEERNMKRISFTIPETMLAAFDDFCDDQELKRSEVIREAIRSYLNRERIKDMDKFMDGFLIISFNHHQRGLQDELTHIEHHSPVQIYSTMHVHVGAENCSEIIALKGSVREINELMKKIKGVKGMLICELVSLYTYDEKNGLEIHHDHHHETKEK